MYLLTEWEGRSIMNSTQILVRDHDRPSSATSVSRDRVPLFRVNFSIKHQTKVLSNGSPEGLWPKGGGKARN